MKRELFIKTIICAAFVGFIFCLGAQAARAQNVQPFVDCFEVERASNGGNTGYYIAYFGYINYRGTTSYIPLNTAGNIVSPDRNPPGQPENFLPGINHRVFSVKYPFGTNATWRLSTYSATVSTQSAGACNGDGTNARLMTYQGRLNDGGTTASGVYDLQFQLFNAATGGAARTTKIIVEDVTVTNGVFTVQLDLGANSIVNAGNVSQPLNPSILSGENGFFEIGVRRGNSIDEFTLLTPRQPLTAAPWAMRANTADNAVRAAYADNATNAINATNAANTDKLGGVDASQYVKTNSAGDLTVGCRSGFTPIANGRLCVSAMQPSATFYGASGAVQICTNMGARVGASADAMLTFSQSGFNYFGGASSGWLADIIGDDVRATWNVPSPTPNFDGTPLNVLNGAGGGAPLLPFRCVY